MAAANTPNKQSLQVHEEVKNERKPSLVNISNDSSGGNNTSGGNTSLTAGNTVTKLSTSLKHSNTDNTLKASDPLSTKANTSMIPGVKKKVNDMATIFKTQATPQGELDLSNKSKK